MESVKLRLTNRDTMVESVHAYLDKWELENGSPEHAVLLRVALQEWLANLHQHADFGNGRMEVILDSWIDGEVITCTVEDNSLGFDIEGQIDAPSSIDHDGDSGRGLFMIRQIATEGLTYEPIGSNRHRLTMRISNKPDLWDNILS